MSAYVYQDEKSQSSANVRAMVSSLSSVDGHGRQFFESSDVEIVTAYNSEFRGFANYYALADDVKRALGLLELVEYYSLIKTLAMRHKTRGAKIRKALKKGEDYEVHYMVQGEKTHP